MGTETEPFQPTSVPAWKDVVDLEDLAQLVCLALSDYTVWADVDLRRKIDWGLENNQEFFDDDTGLVDDTSINENKGCTSCYTSNQIIDQKFVSPRYTTCIPPAALSSLPSRLFFIVFDNQPTSNNIDQSYTHARFSSDRRPPYNTFLVFYIPRE